MAPGSGEATESEGNGYWRGIDRGRKEGRNERRGAEKIRRGLDAGRRRVINFDLGLCRGSTSIYHLLQYVSL
jgi:hypothetical protein